MILTRRNKTVAKCMYSAPKNCEEMECEEGLVCEMRNRVRDGLLVPRCKPATPVVNEAQDCSQLDCREGLACEVLEVNRAKCVKPPVPTDCKEIDCGEGMECKEVGNFGRVKCVQVFIRRSTAATPIGTGNPLPTGTGTPPPTPRVERRCNELDCEPGYYCSMVANRAKNGDRKLRPTCMPIQCPVAKPRRPPHSCREIRCGRDEECVMCQEGRGIRARCAPRSPFPTRSPRPFTPPTPDTRRPNQTAVRTPPTPGTRRPNRTPPTPDTRRPNRTAVRTPPTESGPQATRMPRPGMSRPTRMPRPGMSRPTRMPRPGMPRPTRMPRPGPERPTGEDRERRRPLRRPPMTCEELECDPEMEMCFEFERRNRTLARCVSECKPLTTARVGYKQGSKDGL